MLTKERWVSFFSEKSPEAKGIEVRDNLGIETVAGLVDIRVNTELLEKDILASVERESPQFREKAIGIIDRLRVYLGKRPLSDVVVEELTNRGGVTKEKEKLLKTLFLIKNFISFDSTISAFYANEKCPFFYFNTPKVAEKTVKLFRKRGLPEQLKESWLHERGHFVDFLDPVRRTQLYQDQGEIWKVFAVTDSLLGLSWGALMAAAIYKEDEAKISRRTFLKAALGGAGTTVITSAVFSPLALSISKEFTYWRGHEGEKAARREVEEGILIAPFEEIFHIEFKQV